MSQRIFFGGHIAFTGCPSVLRLFVDAFFELAVDENCVLPIELQITIILSYLLWSHSVISVTLSVKFRQFENNSCVFDRV